MSSTPLHPVVTSSSITSAVSQGWGNRLAPSGAGYCADISPAKWILAYGMSGESSECGILRSNQRDCYTGSCVLFLTWTFLPTSYFESWLAIYHGLEMYFIYFSYFKIRSKDSLFNLTSGLQIFRFYIPIICICFALRTFHSFSLLLNTIHLLRVL